MSFSNATPVSYTHLDVYKRQRMDHVGEPSPVSVQIAGTEPQQLAEAARYNVCLLYTSRCV